MPKLLLALIAVCGLGSGCSDETPSSLNQLLEAKKQEAVLNNASLSFSPPTLNFGSVPEGTDRVDQTITATNHATVGVFIKSPSGDSGTTALTDAVDFAVVNNSCAANAALPPGAKCSMTVRFTPKSSGASGSAFKVEFGESAELMAYHTSFYTTAVYEGGDQEKSASELAKSLLKVAEPVLQFDPRVFQFKDVDFATRAGCDPT